MKFRTLAIVVAILAALSGAMWLADRPAASVSADPRVGQPLASAEILDKAADFRVSDAGKTVELKKAADGNWVVTSYYDLPADSDKLSRMADSLAEAKILRLVSTTATYLEGLGFKDTHIQALDANGQSLVDVNLGRNADDNRGRFFRYGTENNAYLAKLDFSPDTDAKGWANATLLKVTPEEIAKIAIDFSSGDSLTATRAKKDDPFATATSPAGQKLKVSTIGTIVENLAGLHFLDTAALDDANVTAAKANSRTVTLTTFDGKNLAFIVGRKPEVKTPKPATAKTAPTPDATAPDASKPDAAKPDASKPSEPEFDLTPAGPVFVFASSSDAKDPINGLMAKRAFQVPDDDFTLLPQTQADLYESDAPVTKVPSESISIPQLPDIPGMKSIDIPIPGIGKP